MNDDYTPKSGDLCRILPGFKAQHFACDDHPDGTVTDILTGEVIRGDSQ